MTRHTPIPAARSPEEVGRSPASQGRAAAANAVEPVSAVSSKASIPNAVRLSDNERAVLLGMWAEHDSEYDDFCGNGASWFFPFKEIASIAPSVQPRLIRRTVRALARKGLAGFSKGLCRDDGTFLGAGYGLTRAGRELAASMEAAQ